MSETIRLMQLIGSPFPAPSSIPVLDKGEMRALYDLAKRNKISLLFLQKLSEMGMLGELEVEYSRRWKDYEVFLSTIRRIYSTMAAEGIEGVIFKTIVPFPTNLNDVDLLLLKTPLISAVDKFEHHGYARFASAPTSISIHDCVDSKHLDPVQKDPYDIDVYCEISANRIVYLDKKKLQKLLIPTELMGTQIMMLPPEVDLVAQLVHSVFSEQLYTLLHYYSALYYISAMNMNQINNLLATVRENHVTIPIKAALALTAQLHNAATGEVPPKLRMILKALGGDADPASTPQIKDIRAPVRYDLMTVTQTIIEKTVEHKTALSLLQQLVSMIDPRMTKYIAFHLLLRRRRATY